MQQSENQRSQRLNKYSIIKSASRCRSVSSVMSCKSTLIIRQSVDVMCSQYCSPAELWPALWVMSALRCLQTDVFVRAEAQTASHPSGCRHNSKELPSCSLRLPKYPDAERKTAPQKSNHKVLSTDEGQNTDILWRTHECRVLSLQRFACYMSWQLCYITAGPSESCSVSPLILQHPWRIVPKHASRSSLIVLCIFKRNAKQTQMVWINRSLQSLGAF